MKLNKIWIIGLAATLSACNNKDKQHDATGIFEATEINIAARNTGELVQFDIEEGQNVEAGIQLGYIDTTQLHLKKLQLLANLKAVGSRHYNVSRQIATLRQQIATQKNEQKRFENLMKSNAANQKQLDDIGAQIALLEKQLAAQTETLENSNKAVSGESLALEAQIAQLDDQIQKSIISSPIRGTILSKYAQQGEMTSQGKTLLKVGDLTNMHLRAYITADQLTSLKLGQSVAVFADMGKDAYKEYPGVISWISDKAEFTPKTIQTRNERSNLVYAVKVAVTNDGVIKKGMYGEIKIK